MLFLKYLITGEWSTQLCVPRQEPVAEDAVADRRREDACRYVDSLLPAVTTSRDSRLSHMMELAFLKICSAYQHPTPWRLIPTDKTRVWQFTDHRTLVITKSLIRLKAELNNLTYKVTLLLKDLSRESQTKAAPCSSRNDHIWRFSLVHSDFRQDWHWMVKQIEWM